MSKKLHGFCPKSLSFYSSQYSFLNLKTAALFLPTKIPDSEIEAFPVWKTSKSIIAGHW